MERATTSRREARAGSLTVSELLARTTEEATPLDTRELDVPAAAPEGLDTAPEAVAPGSGTSALGSAARATSIGVGVLALCGALGAASLISAQREPANRAPEVQSASALTGAHALRPDEVASRLPAGRPGAAGSPAATQHVAGAQPSTGTSAPAAAGSGAASTQSAGDAGTVDSSPLASTGTAPTAGTAAPSQQEDSGPADVVGRFYRLLGTQPSGAAALLDPQLLGSGLPDFVASWSQARAVDVEQVTQRSSDTVEAVVRVLRPDGSWLRLRQLVTLAGGKGDVPVIEQVRLLSAQRG